MMHFTKPEFKALFKFRDLPDVRKDSAYDGWRQMKKPGRLIKGYTHLSLMDDYELRGFQSNDGFGGHGRVFAMKKDSQCPDRRTLTNPDKPWSFRAPKEALPNLMDAVTGQPTPQAYLSASMFARDIDEIGAIWHSAWWSDHELLFAAPKDLIKDMQLGVLEWPAEQKKIFKLHPEYEQEWLEQHRYWTPIGKLPGRWLPSVRFNRKSVTVTFYARNRQTQERIIKFVDRYSLHGDDKAPSFAFTTQTSVLAEGKGGIIH